MIDREKPGLGRAMVEPGPVLLGLAALAALLLFFGVRGLIIAAVLFAGSVALAAYLRNSPAFQLKVSRSRTKASANQEKWKRTLAVEKLDQESRVRVKNVIKCFEDVAGEIETMGLEGLSSEFNSMALQAEILVKRSIEMAERRSRLLSYLMKTNPDSIKASIANMQQTDNSEMSGQAQENIVLCQQELDTINQSQATADKILQYLETASVSMSSMRARLLSLRNADTQAALAAGQEYSRQINRLSESADVLESESVDLTALAE